MGIKSQAKTAPARQRRDAAVRNLAAANVAERLTAIDKLLKKQLAMVNTVVPAALVHFDLPPELAVRARLELTNDGHVSLDALRKMVAAIEKQAPDAQAEAELLSNHQRSTAYKIMYRASGTSYLPPEKLDVL